MVFETLFFMYICYKIDSISTQVLPKISHAEDPTFNPSVLASLEEDVLEERKNTELKLVAALQRNLNPTAALEGGSQNSTLPPLIIERLRKVFPPKHAGASAVVATQDACFSVESGEIFGLLGYSDFLLYTSI